MTDFCRKCAKEMGFPEADLTIEKLKLKPEYYVYVLCEGCGYIFLSNEDGKEVVYRKDKHNET